jgi:HSP20 family protein
MKKKDEENNIFSVFNGLDKIINIVSDMVENDKKEVNVSGDIVPDHEKKIVGKYGFNIKLGPESISSPNQIKTFNDMFDKKFDAPKTVEPVTDIFEEEEMVTIVLELPGVEKEDIGINLNGKSITITAAKNGTSYLKKIVLKFDPDPGTLKENFNNSIYSISVKGRT